MGMKFGLEQQGHIETIESMLDQYKSREEIESAIGWAGGAANEYYIRYLRKKVAEEQQEARNDIKQEILEYLRDLADEPGAVTAIESSRLHSCSDWIERGID